MIRVLHVIDRLKKVSGIARAILNYYEYIDTSKVQFDFLTVDSDSDIVNEINARGGRVFEIDKLGINNLFSVKKQIESFFSSHKDEYLIIHSSFYHIDFLIFPIARDNGARFFVSHSHNTRFSDSRIREVRNSVMCKMSLKYTNEYVACSKKAAEFQFGKRIVDSGKVFILNNAIDAERFRYNPIIRDKIRNELKIQDKYVIGSVGRFSKQKNHSFIFEIFAKYAPIDRQAILLLVGEGDLMEHYKTVADNIGLADRIIFLGARPDVPNILQAMDCYIFPSLYEGLGISLIEAQAAGLPCIASSNIPFESKVSSNVKYLNIDDEEPWVEEIVRVKSKPRIDTFDEIVNAGYEIRNATQQLENYYESLVRDGK